MTRDIVILDLDGTLLDTRARHYLAYAETVVSMCGKPMPPGRFWAAKRRAEPWSALLARTFDRAVDCDMQRGFLDLFVSSIEDEAMLALDRVRPAVWRALAHLKAAHLKAVLVTARRREDNLARQLDALGLRPSLLEIIATGEAPKHAVVGGAFQGRLISWIGDAEDDFHGARSLGIEACLVTNGIRNRTFLGKLRPDRLVSNVAAAVQPLQPTASGRNF